MNEEMAKKVSAVRAQLAASAGKSRGRGRGYAVAAREAAVAVAKELKATGLPSRQVAKALGVHETTMLVWSRSGVSGTKTPFAEARIVDRPAAAAVDPLRLVLASGARVEGLDVATLIVLVRALG